MENFLIKNFEKSEKIVAVTENFNFQKPNLSDKRKIIFEN